MAQLAAQINTQAQIVALQAQQQQLQAKSPSAGGGGLKSGTQPPAIAPVTILPFLPVAPPQLQQPQSPILSQGQPQSPQQAQQQAAATAKGKAPPGSGVPVNQQRMEFTYLLS